MSIEHKRSVLDQPRAAGGSVHCVSSGRYAASPFTSVAASTHIARQAAAGYRHQAG